MKFASPIFALLLLLAGIACSVPPNRGAAGPLCLTLAAAVLPPAPALAGNIADTNCVDYNDLELLTEQWCACAPSLAADLDSDGCVDFNDYAVMAADWMRCSDASPPEPNLVAYWKFDDADGNVARDSTGNGNDGNLIDAPGWTTGRKSGALRFVGSFDAVQVPTDDLDLTHGAVSMWIYPESFWQSKHFLFGHAVVSQTWSNRIQLYVTAAGDLAVRFGSETDNVGIAQLNTNTWYHLLLTWNNGDYRVDVNEVSVWSGTYATAGLTALNAYADIGNNGSRADADEAFNGIIDDVKLYDRYIEIGPVAEPNLAEQVDTAMTFAEAQVAVMGQTLSTGDFPIHTLSYASWATWTSSHWTSGFFPGSLWLMYEQTAGTDFRALAESWTAALESEKYNTSTHDIGFMIFTSFGNAYRLTGDTAYRDVILQAAQSLSTRYDSTVGVIDYGDWTEYDVPVCVDTMMNLELLLWASQHGGQAAWGQMALNHAYRSLSDLVRPDGSTYHEIAYDPCTAEVIARYAAQGYDVNSTWSRGHTWAMYGFTMVYRYTLDPNMLAAAKRVCDYYIDNVPADGVPYWDFNAPGIPDTERDSSAASVAASALLELSTFVSDPNDEQKYYDAACSILTSLCRSDILGGYLAQDLSENPIAPGILMHGCYHHPESAGGTNIPDENLVWGDYYFIEALLRYKALVPDNAPSP